MATHETPDALGTSVEPVAFELRAFSEYDEADPPVIVSWSELRSADVGDRWECRARGTRGIREESAEVVYRSADGVAVLHRVYRIPDAPGVTRGTMRVGLHWYAFRPPASWRDDDDVVAETADDA